MEIRQDLGRGSCSASDAAGAHEFPFTFHLPHSLAPSSSLALAHKEELIREAVVRYYVQAALQLLPTAPDESGDPSPVMVSEQLPVRVLQPEDLLLQGGLSLLCSC